MDLNIRIFDEPDETRTFEKGRLDLVTIAGRTLGRASYEPGWKWSEHVGPGLGKTSCDVEHLGFVVSGRAVAAMDGGIVVPLETGALFAIPPGHDSWVIGDEPYISIHLMGASDYATRHDDA